MIAVKLPLTIFLVISATDSEAFFISLFMSFIIKYPTNPTTDIIITDSVNTEFLNDSIEIRAIGVIPASNNRIASFILIVVLIVLLEA